MTLVTLLVFFLPGCSPPKKMPYAQNIRNVIIIACDTLRAGHLGFMGYERDTSPFIDSIAERSVVFENMYTPKSLTLPSFTSFFSGQHPTTTKIYKNMWPLAEDQHMLTEDFKKAGYQTMFFSASGILHSRYKLNKGFDFYRDADPHPEPAEHILQLVKEKLDEGINKPLFLTVHFWTTHSPYDPYPEYEELFADPEYEGPMNGTVDTLNAYNLYQLDLEPKDIRHGVDLYDGEIRELNDEVRDLWEYFDEKGLIDNSLIIFWSDHGERLGEEHLFQHRRDSEWELHVPLFMHFPGDFMGGTRISSLAETTDILPTVMEILGVRAPKNIDGISLYPLFENPDADHRNVLISLGVDDSGKFLFSQWDGFERVRIPSPVPDPVPVFLDEQDLERLRALGYIDD
ncbi:MAG TPA: sulfatase [bacterium]